MATKTFKIGEYAKGGIIIAIVAGSTVRIECRDYDTKKMIYEYDTDNREALVNVLNDLTSSYWADKILDFVESKIKLNTNQWRSS